MSVSGYSPGGGGLNRTFTYVILKCLYFLGRNTPQDGENVDDVYEKISDEDLDFFDEENSKSNKPASLEDIDWSALAAIAPASKKGNLKQP